MKLAMREVRVLRSLDHPAVVKLLDAFRSKTGRVYMVFPYLQSTAYHALCVNREGLPAGQIKLIAWQVAQALAYLHGKKIVHRDIKPANILLGESDSVKLCDFGFARVTRCGPREVERLSSYVVTRWYRAPEVLVGDSYGPASDIWSLGCAMAELATGMPIFQGRSTADQLWRIMRCFGPLTPHQETLMKASEQLTAEGLTVPPRGRSLRERLPASRVDPSLFHFLEACLKVEPRARPTAAELLQMPYFWSVPKLLAPSVKAEYDAWEAQQRQESKRQRANEEEPQPQKESRSEAAAPPPPALAVQLPADEDPAEAATTPTGPDPPSAQLVLIPPTPDNELLAAEPSPSPASLGVGMVVDVAALGTRWAGPAVAEGQGPADGCGRMEEGTTSECDEVQESADTTAPDADGASDPANVAQQRRALEEAVALESEKDSEPQASTRAAVAEPARVGPTMRASLSVMPTPFSDDAAVSALAAVISPPGLFGNNRRGGLLQLQEASTGTHQAVGSQPRWPPLFRRAQTLSAANTAPVACLPTEVDPLRVSNYGGGIMIGGGGGMLSQAFSGAQGRRATLQAGPGPIVGILGNAASGSLQLPADSILSAANSSTIRDIFTGGLGPLFDSPAVERYAHTDSANRARLYAGPLAPLAGRAPGAPGGRIIGVAVQGTFAYTPEVFSRVSIASSVGTSRMCQEAAYMQASASGYMQASVSGYIQASASGYMQASASGYAGLDIGALTSPTDAPQVSMVRMSSSGVTEQSRRAVAAAVAAAASLWATQDAMTSPEGGPRASVPGDEQLSGQPDSQQGSQQNSSAGNTSHGARATSKGASGRLYTLERASSLGGPATATLNVHSHSTGGRPTCPHADLLLSAGGRPRLPGSNTGVPPSSRLASSLLKRSGTFATTSCPAVNALPIMDATVEPIEEERSSGNHIPLTRSITTGQAVLATGEESAPPGTSAPTPGTAGGTWESPELAVAAAENLRWRQSVGRQANLAARATTRSRSRLGGAVSTDTAKSSTGMSTPKEGMCTANGPMAVSLDTILLVDEHPGGPEATPTPMPPPSRCQVALRPDSFGGLAPTTASLTQARGDHGLGPRVVTTGEAGTPKAEHEPASATGKLQGLKRSLLRSKSSSKATEEQVQNGDGSQKTGPKPASNKALRALRRLWKRVTTVV
ncbi:hypothetical protein HYH03_015809 [Edaphochlamys debaryana]|nr:hypothetical protein HYH03_015809 [Edaphochlamys debaryana]|eukprot:KAG2485428.1 hypothetical protein HYH03_015809 [Edaphochlamys debaryana]